MHPPTGRQAAPARGVGRARAKATATVTAATLLLAACQTAPTTSPEAVGETRAGSGYLNGYLGRADRPDSLALLPTPPAEGTPAHAADVAQYRATRLPAAHPRWGQAAADAVLKWPAAAGAMACALGVQVSPERTPHLNMLLRRTLADAGLSTYGAKDHYKRPRPFVVFNQPTCTPADEKSLSRDGSYPSGHAALGWAWGLVLAELAPERAQALLARGHAFGQSRVVCGVHWQSDVDQGRTMGAATVARLHADAQFSAQMAAARREIEAARGRGDVPPAAQCAAETAALAAP